ncbi:MAG: 16S rRNA (adenine(1518)-N(6)/adenine(1519)-N(6))-dimethyltransferase RsmA [Bacteroidetes bacterium]|nr:MAG: 16S rRNA (adenine(1518)-N(6)/adenine(1519)-N(6))-dimethyltransferase RsmA [Bacteroidota bacterium]
MTVRAKKHLGQHFLIDQQISQKIADQFGAHQACYKVLEIGPGTGALTKFLLDREEIDLHVIDVDRESIAYLKENFPDLKGKIIEGDFLRMDVSKVLGNDPFAVVGNFPYNISSQILFRCLELRNQVPEIMGMFQKELAERIAVRPGTKTYGVISVLLQTFYDIEYCFTVSEHVFHPPPKVKSGVIRLTRNKRQTLPCDEKFYVQLVKACFNQRRKMIKNTVKAYLKEAPFEHRFLELRPEKLSVEDFIELTCALEEYRSQNA